MWIAGIDGGGTHTRLELRDEENHVVRRAEFGAFNLNSIGEAAFRRLLRDIFAACGGMEDCAALCVGGAGISNPAVGELLAQELKTAGFHGLWKLCGDQEIALRGAMDTPGVALIAGTGSICFGKGADGSTARSGGYGHLIDDGGSGYALGRDVLSAAVRAADGRGRQSALTEAVWEKLHDAAGIVSFVYAPETDKAAIAQLSSLAVSCAEQGDETALQLLRRGAEELAALVEAVQKRLMLEGCPIALLGGLIYTDNAYRRIVVERLHALGAPMTPAHDALWGAAQMAWECRCNGSF